MVKLTPADQSRRGTGRADWHLRANAFVLVYLAAALLFEILRRTGTDAEPDWLTIHLLLLGAITNAILTWSDHFVGALLWSRSHDHRRQLAITVLLNLGILGVLLGVSIDSSWLIIVAATLISVIVLLHLRGISILVKQSLNQRFVGVIRYYQFAGLCILVGIILGVIGTFVAHDDPWEPRIVLAHLHVNLLGWVGLTIIGTLVTLWPTVLRTPMHANAISWALKGLRFLIAGISLVLASALFDWPKLFALGLLLYLVGAFVALIPAALLIPKKRPDRPGSWMLLSGAIGLAILLLADMTVVLSHQDPERALGVIEGHILLLFTLWLLPTLLGALTYLLPVVLGRGPASNRELESLLARAWKFRLFSLFLSSIFLTLPGQLVNVGRVLLAIPLCGFLVLAFTAVYKSAKLRKSSKIIT